MTRTPDEIKKGLEHCINGTSCRGCPYCEECAIASDCNPMHKDLQEYIQQLEAERDAAIHDMNEAQSIVCLICKNYYQPDPAVKKYGCKVLGEHFGEGSIFCGMFEWRGVQKEGWAEDGT